MSMHKVFLTVLGVLLMASSAQATVITGNINNSLHNTNWPVHTDIVIGDGTNQVYFSWRSWSAHKSDFEGEYSDVAFATGITNISQITDASIFNFTAHQFHPDFGGYSVQSIGPYCDAVCDPDGVGDFIVSRSISTGHYGVLRIDDIKDEFVYIPEGNDYSLVLLNATWWFQTDGTGDFSSVSSVSSVPEPSTYMLFSIGLLVLLGYRVRQKGLS